MTSRLKIAVVNVIGHVIAGLRGSWQRRVGRTHGPVARPERGQDGEHAAGSGHFRGRRGDDVAGERTRSLSVHGPARVSRPFVVFFNRVLFFYQFSVQNPKKWSLISHFAHIYSI